MQRSARLSISEVQWFTDPPVQTAALVGHVSSQNPDGGAGRTFGVLKRARIIPQLCLFSPPSADSFCLSG